MKNIFVEVVSTVDVAEEMGCINRILENKKNQENKYRRKSKTRIFRDCGTTIKV